MQVFAVLLGLGGACCLYLASPNQRLLLLPLPVPATERSRRTRLCWLATLSIAASAWAWSLTQGWPAAIAATLATLGTGLSLWPFAGAYRDARRQRLTRAGE